MDDNYLSQYPIRLRVVTIPYNSDEEAMCFNEFGYKEFGEALRDYDYVNEFISEMAWSYNYAYRLEITQSNLCHNFKAWDYDGSVCEEINTLHPHNCLYKTITNNKDDYDVLDIEYSQHPIPLPRAHMREVMKF